jgi:hypothetical protein
LILKLKKDKIFPVYNQIELNKILKPTDDIVYLDAHADFLYPKNGILHKLKKTYDLKKKIVYQDSTILYHFKSCKD